jgi:serine/threonine protein phosphatase 1
MFDALKRRGQPHAAPGVPAGLRLYAIGDVHGRADLLQQLLAAIDRDDQARAPADTQIVLLGDLIDRGPASADVIELALQLAARRPSTRFLMGNHEEVLLRALAGERGATAFFRRMGGRETMRSYGLSEAEINDPDADALGVLFAQRIPAAHRDFIAGFEDIVVAGDYAFVHAGIRPGVPLEKQATADLRWIRAPFLDHAGALGHVVVHGHTITDTVDERHNRIGIDTGAFQTDRLTAIGLEGTERWYLST